MSEKPPIRRIHIHDQQLWQLRLPQHARPLEWLKPNLFRLAGMPDDELRLADVDRNPWESVTQASIVGALRSGQLRRLCVTTNAGIGKSTFLRWLQLQFSQPDSGLIPFRLELRDLPASSQDIWDQCFEDKLRPRTGGTFQGQPMRDPSQVLERLRLQRRLCLLVDSLDQTSKGLDDRIRALSKFLSRDFCDFPVVVAGRTHAITHFWEDLFEGRQWQMLQPGMFTEEQVRRYLGPKRYGRLQKLGVNIRQNPRAISVIAGLPEDRLQVLRTEADVYWEMLDEQLQLALRVDAVKTLERPHVEFLYCLIAFRLLQDGNRAEVSSQDYGKFADQLFRERTNEICTALGRSDLDEMKFRDVLFELLCVNDILEHGGFERHGRPQKTEARLAFQNPSQFEFLAAMWLTRWASVADVQWLQQHLPGEYDGHVEAINNVWRHLTEMPEVVRAGTECCWLKSIEPLFQPVPGARHARPAPWMYRCWRLLLAYADPDWAEVSVQIPQLKTVRNTDLRFTEIRETARRILLDFRGKGQVTQKVMNRTAWVWCPPQAKDGPVDAEQRTFWMGTPDNQRQHKDFREWLPEPFLRKTVPLEFELQVAPVTNLEYEQFDEWHRSMRDRRSSEDGQAAIWLSLFDSFVYACWMGPEYRLPTELEWEFACRADSAPGLLSWWGDDDQKAKRWADDNSGGKVPKSTSEHANAWGVQDQIGLVWEWTGSRTNYTQDIIWRNESVRRSLTPDACSQESESSLADPQSAFVLRGGSWDYSVAALLRCGGRDYILPTVTSVLAGCRLSRVARARKP